jgi:hypothetical protein
VLAVPLVGIVSPLELVLVSPRLMLHVVLVERTFTRAFSRLEPLRVTCTPIAGMRSFSGFGVPTLAGFTDSAVGVVHAGADVTHSPATAEYAVVNGNSPRKL